MKEPIFFDRFSHQFLPGIEPINQPIPLIYDGHYTHISILIIKIAMNSRVQIECLQPHITTILQPLPM